MRIVIICIAIVLCLAVSANAEQRHTFYEAYNPASAAFVYDDTGATTTGDVVDVFTYDLKTIFISVEQMASDDVYYQIEGRPVGERDTWSVLDEGAFGKASADTERNFAIDVTELTDYIRVGLKVTGDGVDRINVRGIFRKSN